MLNKHLMLDIESIGKRPGCVVFAIGAIIFDVEKIFSEHLFKLSVKESISLGFIIDQETRNWWINDRERRILANFLTKNPSPIRDVMHEILYLRNQTRTHWAWGIDFDFPMIEAIYDKLNIVFDRFVVRDARTVCKLAKTDNRLKPHNPILDAKEQVICLQKAIIKLGVDL